MKPWPNVADGTPFLGWNYFNLDEASMKHEGWKIHVTARPRSRAVAIIKQVCARYDTPVKFLPSRRAYEGQTGEQRGKWNAVYPSSPVMAMGLAQELSDELRRAHCSRLKARERPPYDLYVCPFICIRYGSYIDGTVIKPDGTKTADSYKKSTFKPPWIDNIWVNFNALNTPGNREGFNFGKAFPDYRLR